METLFKSVLDMYMDEKYIDNYDAEFIEFEKKNDKWLPVERIDIGPTAKADLNSLTNCKAEDKYMFCKVCQEFLVELAKQINMRFPFKERNIKMLRDLQFIDPQNLKNIKDITEVSHLFGYDVVAVHNEYKKLRRTFKRDLETDIFNFWKKIQLYHNENGEVEFPLCLQIVQRVLLLPHSSANCERIFSEVALNKTKTRNKLSTESLNGILWGKSLVRKIDNRKSILNINYKPMIPLFTKDIYSM